jgi:hypothetical protein
MSSLPNEKRIGTGVRKWTFVKIPVQCRLMLPGLYPRCLVGVRSPAEALISYEGQFEGFS